MNEWLNIWELALRLNKPKAITKVKVQVEYEEGGELEDILFLMGTVVIYLETAGSYAYIYYTADTEVYTGEEDRRRAMLWIESRMEELLREELESNYLETFWETHPLNEMDWKKKE